MTWLLLKLSPFLLLLLFWSGKAEASVLSRAPNNLGLVGYWSMNDGAGATASDFSGNKNQGTLTSMDPSTDWVNGRHGKALDFDASNDYVFLGSSLYDSHQQGSVAAWIKFYGGGNYFFSAASYTSSAYVLAFNIITISGSPRLRINELNGDYVYANQGLSPGRWYFVTVTSNGSTWKIYIDGVEQSLSVQLGSNTGEWFGDEAAGGGSLRYDIGVLARSSGLSGYFNGLIDDVRIYNRALSAAEVRALYQAGQVAQRNPNNLGLVGYWSMNDGAGATATDFSGQKNHGTLTNMDPSTDWVNGRHGKALDFDGSNDYADAGTNSSLAINQGALTISAWFKLNGDYTTAQAIIANAISGNGNANYALTFGFTDNKIEYWPNSSGPIFTSNLSISDNAWYHVVMVRDGSDNNWTGWMYIDGKLDKTSTFLGSSNNPASPTTAIGRFGAFNGYYWNGRLDDVRVYNRTLSAAEVAALYRAGQVAQRNPNNSGLVGYWSMNDGAGATATDFSGNKKNGTLTNMDPSTDWVNGRHGKALDFDGSNDYVDVGTGLDQNGAVTMSAWIKTNTVAVGIRDIVTNCNSAGNACDYAFEVNRTAGKVTLLRSAAAITVTSNASLSANVWYHVVGVLSGSSGSWTGTIYINGVLDKSGSDTNNPSGSNETTTIGRAGAGSSYYFNGLIDDVRVYNRALSAAEVRALYDSR